MDWMRVGLDVEAAGAMAEVQNEKETVADLTIKTKNKRHKYKL